MAGGQRDRRRAMWQAVLTLGRPQHSLRGYINPWCAGPGGHLFPAGRCLLSSASPSGGVPKLTHPRASPQEANPTQQQALQLASRPDSGRAEVYVFSFTPTWIGSNLEVFPEQPVLTVHSSSPSGRQHTKPPASPAASLLAKGTFCFQQHCKYDQFQ